MTATAALWRRASVSPAMRADRKKSIAQRRRTEIGPLEFNDEGQLLAEDNDTDQDSPTTEDYIIADDAPKRPFVLGSFTNSSWARFDPATRRQRNEMDAGMSDAVLITDWAEQPQPSQLTPSLPSLPSRTSTPRRQQPAKGRSLTRSFFGTLKRGTSNFRRGFGIGRRLYVRYGRREEELQPLPPVEIPFEEGVRGRGGAFSV